MFLSLYGEETQDITA